MFTELRIKRNNMENHGNTPPPPPPPVELSDDQKKIKELQCELDRLRSVKYKKVSSIGSLFI